MAGDENLAARIRDEVSGEASVGEMKMFRDLAFLIGAPRPASTAR